MAYVPYAEVGSIEFYVLSSKDNRQESNVNVMYQDQFRNGLPYPGGIYDPHMGTTDHTWDCETCQHDKRLCPGHPGSCKLNSPVPSPLFIKEVIKWLRVICFQCGKLVVKEVALKVPREKILGEYVKIARNQGKNLTCVHCKALHPHIEKGANDPVSIFMKIYEERGAVEQASSKYKLLEESILYPHYIKMIFRKITPETVNLLGKPLACHPKKFLIEVLRVPPNTIRPDVKKINAGRSNSNDLTILLQTIMKINDQIPSTLPGRIEKDLELQIHNLSLAVFDLIRGSSGSTTKRGIVSAAKKPLTSVAKRWPRKFGRVRRNLMGRRVEHIGRSFITGDPFRKIDEVGVPIVIAKEIQHPMVVREYNYKEAMVYFMNGNKRYPGCKKIKKASTGAVHWIGRIKEDFKLEIGDVIYRDTIDGDPADFNRQPTLEPSSISAMKCVVMEEGDSFRLNVLSCVFFNADFDGDAMNLIFPRSSRTRNEIMNLASPAQFFISYKDGKPKVGEAQDSVVGLAELTRTGVRIDKYHAMQYFSQVNVYHDFSKRTEGDLYDGRDIISIYLKETNNLINLVTTPRFYNPDHARYRHYHPSDIRVEIDRGSLKTGVLDKNTIGEGANGGIFHIIHNQYGPQAALDASYYMQQIAISYLDNKGFTMSLGDLILKDDALEDVHRIESSLIAESRKITENLNKGRIIAPIGKTLNEYYEEQQINALNPGDEFWGPILRSIDPEHNCMYKAIMYGARGALFNFKNTVSAIGQIEINGERMKENFGGRSLCYFTKYDPNPQSRGYITGSYISGITPTEFLFHTQDARYQLINKALSTSITGSYNRMAIKNLEAVIIDNQRKAMNGQRITQTLYGADGADPRFIEKVKFPTMRRDLTWEGFEKEFKARPEQFQKVEKGLETALEEEFKQLVEDRKFYTELFLKQEVVNPQQSYQDGTVMPVNPHRIIEDTLYNLELKKWNLENSGGKEKSSLEPLRALEKVRELCNDIQYCLLNSIQRKKGRRMPLHLRYSCNLLKILIRSHLNLANLVRRGVNNQALDIVIEQIKMFYSKSLVSYGKAVGIIASQSISEPMTQMVLDSHHYSGAGSTKKRGLVRVREILSARPTEKMKSPAMTLHVIPELRKNKLKVQELANHIEMLPLKQFVSSWQVFFEKYGEPVHPAYKGEREMIQEFEKYHLHTKPPGDLTNWCVRLVLDKGKLIEKQLRMDSVYHRLRQEYPATHIVYSTDNSDQVVVRVYLRGAFVKKGALTTYQVVDIVREFLSVVIRGIPGIRAAYVKEGKVNELQEDGSITSESIYYIFTDGTNLQGVLENPLVDPDRVQTDSISETYDLFGISAARNKIINELKYQISGSSHRHYTVYADEMTHSGVITSIDRYGSAKRNSSFMLRISDADPIRVIEESAVNAFTDDLSGVSPPLMIGKTPRVGDTYNSFKLDESFVKEHVKNLDTLLEAL